jgi:hypothetical protein
MVISLKENYATSIKDLLIYKTMWCLRSLEKEMDEEGGMIIISLTKPAEIKGYSTELSKRIYNLLSKFEE